MTSQPTLERASLTPDPAWSLPDGGPSFRLTNLAAIDGIRALIGARLREAGDGLPLWFADATANRFVEHHFLFTRVILLELRIARLLGMLRGATSSERYASFVSLLETESFRGYVARKYPVLEQYCVRQIAHYAAASARIEETLAASTQHERRIRTASFVGDPHEHGRQGAIVEFEDGSRVVIKPRSAVFDGYFRDVIELANPYLRVPLRLAHVEQVADHSVSEWLVDAPSLVSEAYVYGCWVALAQYHNLLDLHYENFVITAAGPTPVDLECAFNPTVRVDQTRGPDQDRAAREPLWRGALIPRTSAESAVELRWSPLANDANRAAGGFQVVRADGTDKAHLQFVPEPPDGDTFQSSILADEADFEDLARGFSDLQQALSQNDAQLIALRAVHRIGETSTRVVRKPTRFYSDVLRRSFHPRFLVDPEQHRALIADHIARSGDPTTSVAGAFEIAKLEAGFIPAFFSRVEEVEILADGSPIEQRIVSGLAAHEARIQELGNEELRALDRRTLRQMLVCLGGAPWPDVALLRPRSVASIAGTSTAIRELGLSVASNLWAGTSERDRVVWHNIIDGGEGNLTVEESSYDLYNGSAGTMLALLSATEDGERTPGIARLTEELMESLHPWLLATGRFGAFSGAAGGLYALWNAQAHGYISRSALRTLATQVLEECVVQVARTEEWDVFSGRAGLLLLLARFRDAGVVEAQWADALAGQLVEGLLECRLPQDSDGRWWWKGPNMDGGLGGFVHGVAGVALATGQWPLVEHARALRDAARESQQSLRRGAADWRDTRPYAAKELLDAWCHGAGGILLADEARNAMTTQADHNAWAQQAFSSDGDLTLCHGLAGKVVAGVTLLGVDHPYTASHTAALREHAANRWALPGGHLFELSDSLFTGQSGALFALSFARDGGRRVGDPLLLTIPPSR